MRSNSKCNVIWYGIILISFGVTINKYKDFFLPLDEVIQIWTYICLGGWGLELLINGIKGFLKLSMRNVSLISKFENLYTFAMIGYAIWGLTLIYTDEILMYRQLTYESNQLIRCIESMAWIRIIPLLICGCVCFIMICFFCCAMAAGGGNMVSMIRARQAAQNSFVSRIPIVSSFLNQHARAYDPEKDGGVEQCAICMVDFTVDDPKPVAELNCSNKHIFHLECIQEWVKRQDTCPMCRESIAK